MGFNLLSDYIQWMQPHLPNPRPAPHELRQAALRLAVATFGQGAFQATGAINIAGLALSLPRLTVYRPDAAAVAQVEATDLRNLPAEPPRLLQHAFLIESPDPARGTLFADIVALGGYAIGPDWWLIGLKYPDGITVTRWNPIWETGEEVAAGIIYDNSPLIDHLAGWEEIGRQAARFCLLLGLLLDAESTPVEERVREPKPARGKGGAKAAEGWQVRALTIPPSKRPAKPAEAPGGSLADGRHTEVVPVRGHLRWQPHGPGRTERKWVYVESYEARRWVSPRPLRVNVRGERSAQ